MKKSKIPAYYHGMKRNRPLLRPYEKAQFQAIFIFCSIFCLVFTFLPLSITIINSLKTEEQVAANIFALPHLNTMFQAMAKNFSAAWNEIGSFFLKTILVSLVGAFFEVLIGALLAYILTFKEFYFKKAVFLFFIAILLVPSIIGYPMLVPLIRDRFGLGDTYIGYLLPMIGGSQVGGMFLFRTFFSQQPKSLYESAQIAGANDFQIFTKITVPLGLSILLYAFLGDFSGIYSEYVWASLILDSNLTLMTKMFALVDNKTIEYGAMYAMYIIASIPCIVTTIISMRYFKSGEFASGMKL